MQGTLHTYYPARSLLLFEHHNEHTAAATEPPPTNTLLFVGGMYDNFLTPPYTSDLAVLLRGSRRWRFCHVQLSSAMRGFGTSSLAKDVAELGVAVEFVQKELCSSSSAGHGGDAGGEGDGDLSAAKGKVVLMGHSTGCQDLLSYLTLTSSPGSGGPLRNRPRVDGVVLQAPVSDREGAMPGPDATDAHCARWQACLQAAEDVEKAKQRTTLLPMHLTRDLFGPVPLSVERFLSLASPGSPERPGEDDLFSSDCSAARLRETWGLVGDDAGVLNQLGGKKGGREILVLAGGDDEHVPAWVDKGALLERWRAATEHGGGALHAQSQVVKDGLHDLGGDETPGKTARLVVMQGALLRYLDDVLGEGPEGEVEQVWLRQKEEIEEAAKQGHGGGLAKI